jgi:YD repeat-containing protein
MTNRIITIIAAMGTFICCFGGTSKAQSWTVSCDLLDRIVKNTSHACRIDWNWDDLYLHLPPSGSVVCNLNDPWDSFAVSLKPSCGAPPAPCPSCMAAGAPINLSSGNTFIIESDVSVPGLGGGLRLARTWNSILMPFQNSYPFMFGINWRSTYEERIINGGDGYMKYLRADGSVWSFGVVTTGSPNVYQVAAPANDTTTTLADGSPSWTMTFKNGEKHLFDATTGVLTSIVDRNGNTTQLSYDASNRLTTVADPASRHLTFSYVSPSSNLVSTVTSDVGLTLSYAYDDQGRLTQVTKPDNTTISFQYDANSNITAVLDTNGKVLESHTYDVLRRGLTSSRANGVDAVTVTYPQ